MDNETLNVAAKLGAVETNYYCTECGKMLYLANIVWLELDQRTNTYTRNAVPNEYSQGEFPFGKDCAKKKAKENDRAFYRHRKLY